MAIHTTLRTRRQLRHPDANSKSHIADKAAATERRGVAYVAVRAPGRELSAPLPISSHAKKFDGTAWTPCQPEGFADWLESEHRRRGFFIDQVTRKGQQGRVPMRRKVAAPLENLTVTFSPWATAYFRTQFAEGHDASARNELAQIRDRMLVATEVRLEGKRHRLGYAFHADAGIHLDFPTSRYDGHGNKIGPVGLGLVGPWCVGTDRQVRVGAQISGMKAAQLTRDVASFHGRHGTEAVPLDVALARDMDAAADDVLGEKLEPFKAAYRDNVPNVEAANAAAALAVLDAARAKFLPPQPSTSTPELSA